MPYKLYRSTGTPIYFQDTGGDIVLSLRNLAGTSGRLSAQLDRGSGSKPARYKWRAVMQWSPTPEAPGIQKQNYTQFDYVDILLAGSGGIVAPDANKGTSDVAISSSDAANLTRVGRVVCQANVGQVDNISSGTLTLLDRYFQMAVFNRGTTALANIDNVCVLILTPIPDEVQQ